MIPTKPPILARKEWHSFHSVPSLPASVCMSVRVLHAANKSTPALPMITSGAMIVISVHFTDAHCSSQYRDFVQNSSSTVQMSIMIWWGDVKVMNGVRAGEYCEETIPEDVQSPSSFGRMNEVGAIRWYRTFRLERGICSCSRHKNEEEDHIPHG